MLSDRHDRRMLKLGELLTARKKEIDDHNSGQRRLNSEVRIHFKNDVIEVVVDIYVDLMYVL